MLLTIIPTDPPANMVVLMNSETLQERPESMRLHLETLTTVGSLEERADQDLIATIVVEKVI
jgi:hypothetical protein